MPQMADITVKKNDDTTNVVYTSKAPAAGDNTPAIWRNETVGTAAAHRPELRLSSKDGGDGKSRKMRSTFAWPQIATNSTTGIVSVVEKSSFATDFTLSKTMTQADINECVSQYANLLASALIKQCLKDGFAAS